MVDTSRDPKDLHPLLREAWEYLKARWEQENPNGPSVGLSCTYRGPHDQEAAFKSGASKARFGRSLHNFKPAYAFDIFFFRGRTADWSFKNFEAFAKMAEEINLEWGGRWAGLVDGPHFQFKNATPADANVGVVPNPPVIPDFNSVELVDVPTEDDWKIVVMREGQIIADVPVGPNRAIFTRVSPGRRRFYVDVRTDGT